MIDRLFAYGTLERPMLMGEITGRVPPCVPACLEGCRRGRLAGRTYPGLARDPGGEVRGTLYLGLTRRELALLDRYEGPEYRRVPQGLRTDQGRRRAWVYIQRPGIPLDGDWSRWSGVKKAASGGRVTGPSHRSIAQSG